MKRAQDLETSAALQAAELMAAAARTAPKTRGIDVIDIIVIDDDATKKKVTARMLEIAHTENRPSFERDANSIAASPAIVVIGACAQPAGLNCGFCGYPTCAELTTAHGVCAYNSIDLGIAVGSAATSAGSLHIDNRVMYSVGRACLDLKLFTKKASIALGIPLSITGKSPFFDRK